ncbi:hypothetical protein BRADI_4g19156v3 [Brachypodium distachyon]|uniref:Cathepsin propeptide inhibitor domain-containing protein n=1 Tax=Brachypodium distachyon TaxID=15368 RepID=A0A0Q3L7G3_BRADI|nr:hypothetical protein BRADI_4g19156v3 [Brachypodium distachyon]
MRSSTTLMALLLLLLLVVVWPAAAADIQIPYRERSEEETRRVFVEWKAKVGRTYSSIGEEECHYATFKDNLRDIDKRNVGRIHSDPLRRRLNNFSDLTHEEHRAVSCLTRSGRAKGSVDVDCIHAVWCLCFHYLFLFYTLAAPAIFGSSGRAVGGEYSSVFQRNPF